MDDEEFKELKERVEHGFECIKDNFRITDSRERAIAEALEDLNARVSLLEMDD